MFIDMLEDLKKRNITFFWNILLSGKAGCGGEILEVLEKKVKTGGRCPSYL